MGKEILTFGDIEIEKKTFFTAIRLLFLKNIDTEKVLASCKIFFSEKNYNYFIDYLYNDNKVKPLHITLSNKSAYVKHYDGKTKWVYSLIEDDVFLKNIMLFGIKLALI